MSTTTHPGPSASPDVRAQVREQVSRARHALSLTAAAPESAAIADDQRDFVRHYLRFLSMQAVGTFTETLGRLARGLDVLGRRTTETQSTLAHTEQDVLHLVAALERVRDLPERVAALEARLAPANAGPMTSHQTFGGTAEDFIDAVARCLREVTASTKSERGIALGAVPSGWLVAMKHAGIQMAESNDEAIEHLSPDSADIITALFAFDAMSPSAARRSLEHCRRVTRVGGALFIVIERIASESRPAWLTRLHPRVGEPARLAALVRDCGFDRVTERPLDVAWPTFHLVIGYRA